jgi:hypothetical protein
VAGLERAPDGGRPVTIINAEGTTTTILVAGVCLLVACGVIVWALDRAFNHQPPRDPAATNPWGIARSTT